MTTSIVQVKLNEKDGSYVCFTRYGNGLAMGVCNSPSEETGVSRRVDVFLDRGAISIMVAHLNQLRMELDRQPTDPPIAPKPTTECVHDWRPGESASYRCEKCGKIRVLTTPEDFKWADEESGYKPPIAKPAPAHVPIRPMPKLEFEQCGTSLIYEERQRQMRAVGPGGEGWSAEHDDTHDKGEMAIAAACYAVESTDVEVHVPNASGCHSEDAMPWGSCSDKRKKHSRLRQLVIAGALIAAEIDRIIRRDQK